MKLECGYGLDLEQAQTDGLITTEDADEIRHFGEFLKAIRDVPRPSAEWTGIYAEFYPEDYARAIAERDASKDSGAHAEPVAADAPRVDGSLHNEPREKKSR